MVVYSNSPLLVDSVAYAGFSVQFSESCTLQSATEDLRGCGLCSPESATDSNCLWLGPRWTAWIGARLGSDHFAFGRWARAFWQS
mmetsp:Transcript_31904/g.82676  ORF Transcript_31904/g.82676 Transcript_31904/m.82676 type:complete len:85 (-) Transcript_31904:1039-1293(-)